MYISSYEWKSRRIILAKDPTIFVYIATAVVLLNVLAGGRDHADGIRN